MTTGAGAADDISRGHNIFLMPTVPKLLKLGPNSKMYSRSLCIAPIHQN